MGAEPVVVMGGGLAGLSLAVQLLDRKPDLRLTIVEPRAAYTDDRSWSWWDTDPHPFTHLAAERWRHWRVRTAAGSVTAEAGRYRYCRLPALAVYREGERRLEAAPNAQLCRGLRAHAVRPWPHGMLTVETDAGPLEATAMFDGRPPGRDAFAGTRAPLLWQQFLGRRVRLESAPFDPGIVELMDFRPGQQDGLHFLYVLPASREEALVEATWFVPAPLPRPLVERRLAAELDRLAAGKAMESLAEEAGCLPMTTAVPPAPALPGLIPIGMRAGVLRPATGYGFLAIQRHSAALAERLLGGRPGPVRPHRADTLLLDEIFLRFLLRRPEAAPALFRRLFERCPADRLVRFLSACGGPADLAAAIAALPARPMLSAAWAGARARARLGPA
ncbi:MAG: hypothetical protein GVY13_19490 [Alphaproteobacteria bacterium]|jgi:lycopene beta-cyclase|nr:hypothetical protein [Alphaproteobacteria bacterium]